MAEFIREKVIIPAGFRLMVPSDRETIYHWNTSPGVRKFSRNPNPPTRADHEKWFSYKLSDKNCLPLMILKEENTIGILRLDKKEFIEVSIIVAPEHQGKGYASSALAQIIKMIPAEDIRAEIYPDNTASIKAFQNAGFHPIGKNWYQAGCVPVT